MLPVDQTLWADPDAPDGGPALEHEPEPGGVSLGHLRQLMAAIGVDRMLVKTLAANDNSKQQVYVSPGFAGLNILPNAGIREAPTRGRAGVVYYAPLAFCWVNAHGELAPAPATKLILYPQYPEVRLSGFLQGARFRPSAVMTSREVGRVLVLGIRDQDGAIFAYADSADSILARELRAAGPLDSTGVFTIAPMGAATKATDWRSRLLFDLRQVAAKGWVTGSRRVGADATVPCNNRNCGGLTLESELGIVANSDPAPDYHGIWELKAHSSTTITLFDGVPQGGLLGDRGLPAFMERYGYPDRSDPTRVNFGGVYRATDAEPRRGLRSVLVGFEPETKLIDLKGGRLALVDARGEEALAYPFTQLIDHWRTKHMKTAYVEYSLRGTEQREYLFGPDVLLCEGTDPLRLLAALRHGTVFMDHSPYMKLDDGHRALKFRFPMRVRADGLASLYESTTPERISGATPQRA